MGKESLKITRKIMGSTDISKTLKRIASEIVERETDIKELVLVGIKTRGAPLARRIKGIIEKMTGEDLPIGELDITFYRDDLSMIGEKPLVKGTFLPVNINGRVVLLVDDVLYTGRTVRAAIDELLDYGRPRGIRLCVLIDRGHRELPICPDFVGKTLSTENHEVIIVKLKEEDGIDEVVIGEREDSNAKI
jgi:pyrimidine operon attenuation protein/uracil phosphoribosyltransferase